MKHREVSPARIAKKYASYFDILPKEITLKTRQRMALEATIASIREYQTTVPLDSFFKPVLDDFLKVLNYHGPVFKRTEKET